VYQFDLRRSNQHFAYQMLIGSTQPAGVGTRFFAFIIRTGYWALDRAPLSWWHVGMDVRRLRSLERSGNRPAHISE